MRDGGLFHSNSLGEVGYRKRADSVAGRRIISRPRSRQRLQWTRLRGGLGIQRR